MYNINLAQWTGHADVRFAFETYANFGNPIMIDNVVISQYVGQEEFKVEEDDILIYPNPATNSFTIMLPENEDFELLSLTNHLGQLIFSESLKDGQKHIEVQRKSDWTRGVYYLSVKGEENSVTKKVILY